MRESATANLDETGWREDKTRAWLWVSGTAPVAVFRIARSHGSQVARVPWRWLQGTIKSKRSANTTGYPSSRGSSAGPTSRGISRGWLTAAVPGAIGDALLSETKEVFRSWARGRYGTFPGEQFQARMVKPARRVRGRCQD